MIAILTTAVARAADEGSVFGQSASSEAALMGVMYDFKQFPDHKPTNVGVDQGYCNIITEFINKGWDESVLNRYYRVSRPLFTTQVFVPNMNADNAPKAFGAEKLVKPTAWLIEYKGQVSAPEAGSYRFWGCADDVMAVAIDGKTELVAHHYLTNLSAVKWHQPPPNIGAQAADDFLVPGDWFNMNAGQIVDLDIIISERPGGLFNAFVMIEKQGGTYARDAQGHPILPIFQVAPYDTPMLHDLNTEPDFAKGFPPWKSYQ
jgi:hypothetical protein